MIFFFSLIIGYLPLGDIYLYEVSAPIVVNGTYYTELHAGVEFNGFYVIGDVKTYEWDIEDNISFVQ